jgi:tetratricopeptide (TPR) repeat protein
VCSSHLDLKRHGEALASYERAIELKPDYAVAWRNRGSALDDAKRHEEALASFERAIELKPDYAEAHWNKSLALLRCGFLEEGWKLYEWRWQLDSSTSPRRDFIQPLWRGEQPIAGRTILLHAEQGLGDTIQFYRYVKLVALRGAKVIVEVQNPLVSIFKNLGGSITVVAQGDLLPKFDYHCPLLSLPLAFKTDLNSIPADIPYLQIIDNKLQEWSEKVRGSQRVRIGVAWSGNKDHKDDKNRSIPFSALSKLLSDNFEWFSLQKEYKDGDRQMLRRSKVHDYSIALFDFSDTAALLSQLDLIISVDTSVAHLAGAMGKPTWVMLPYVPDFRWLWDREDSLWYPSMRLFRQPAAGDWSPVIYNVSSALRARYRGIC